MLCFCLIIYNIYNNVLYFLLVCPYTIMSASVYSHLTLTSACWDFPVPISLLASQLYSPLSEGLTDLTVTIWPSMISFFSSLIFIQVTEVTGGKDWAWQRSVNDAFSFTARPGWAFTVTSLGRSALTRNIVKKRRVRFKL